jgi:hypothetical protein
MACMGQEAGRGFDSVTKAAPEPFVTIINIRFYTCGYCVLTFVNFAFGTFLLSRVKIIFANSNLNLLQNLMKKGKQ